MTIDYEAVRERAYDGMGMRDASATGGGGTARARRRDREQYLAELAAPPAPRPQREHSRLRQVGWWDDAACKGQPIEVFFPTIRAGQREDVMYAGAKLVCARCSVREPCLQDALREELRWGRHGVRGGLTPDERKEIDR